MRGENKENWETESRAIQQEEMVHVRMTLDSPENENYNYTKVVIVKEVF